MLATLGSAPLDLASVALGLIFTGHGLQRILKPHRPVDLAADELAVRFGAAGRGRHGRPARRDIEDAGSVEPVLRFPGPLTAKKD